jgi:L-lactate dehydrogenase complex protein LldE
MFNNGFAGDARDLARRMIDVFREFDTVVTPSGSCAAMIREHYPGLFEPGSRDRADAEALAGRTWEFVEFLTHVLAVDLAALGPRWTGRATYHYSCHLRGIGATDEAVRLARRIEGLDLVPLAKVEQCCGFGGTFAAKYPTISGAMVDEKLACIRDTGADTLICNDAGCAMNIAGACRRDGLDVEVKSLAEIIAEALGLLEREAPP